MDSTPKEPLRARYCGRVTFDSALAAQEKLREAVVLDKSKGCMLLCEHPPSVTMGRRAQPEHLLWADAQLKANELSVFETPRGGEATLHAPGQLVVYPVCYVGKQIRAHIQQLADAAIAVLEAAGLRGCEMNWEHPGVWKDGQKFASIGVHVSRGVAIQGLSLNVAVAPALFGALVSCGMPTVQMANLWPLRDQASCDPTFVAPGGGPDLAGIARYFAHAFAHARGATLHYADDERARSSALQSWGLKEG